MTRSRGRASPRRGAADRPHVRLGVAWAVFTFAVAVLGAPALALWLGGTAAVAAMQSGRTWRAKRSRPDRGGAALAAVLPALGAAVGPLGLVAGVVAGVTGAALMGTAHGVAWRTLRTGLPFGLAAAAPVLLRTRGLAEAATLLALTWAFDAGTYVVGAGAHNRWEGPAAGVAGMAVVTLNAAAVLVPPFEGTSAWVLGAAAAAGALLGPPVVTASLGNAKADVPAARRLDSLVLAGPAFAVGAFLLLPS